jgi:hypothetical protein
MDHPDAHLGAQALLAEAHRDQHPTVAAVHRAPCGSDALDGARPDATANADLRPALPQDEAAGKLAGRARDVPAAGEEDNWKSDEPAVAVGPDIRASDQFAA